MTLAVQFKAHNEHLDDLDVLGYQLTASGADYVRYDADDPGRWYYRVRSIFKFSDGSHLELSYARGNTEYQDVDPEPELRLVEPFEKVEVHYRYIDG